MLIAKIDNPVPIDYREVFNNTSFPPTGPSDDFLAEHGYAKVNVFRDHDRASQKLEICTPIYEAPWVYTVQVVNKTQEDFAAETSFKMNELRKKRNQLLLDSDWTQLADSQVDKQAWAAYRQELRDLPQNTTDPSNPTWPIKPE